MAAACAKERPLGLWLSLSSRATAYSANEPLAMPKTSSPTVKTGDSVAGGGDGPGDVLTRDGVLRFEQPEAHETDEVGLAGHDMEHAARDPCCLHPDEYFVATWRRLFDVAEPQHIGRSIPVLGDRLHRRPP
jgi:hypothetical protein